MLFFLFVFSPFCCFDGKALGVFIKQLIKTCNSHILLFFPPNFQREILLLNPFIYDITDLFICFCAVSSAVQRTVGNQEDAPSKVM